MAPVLKEFKDDADVIKTVRKARLAVTSSRPAETDPAPVRRVQVFEAMALWPLLNRAKVEAAHAEDLVAETMLHQAADEEVQTLGKKVRGRTMDCRWGPTLMLARTILTASDCLGGPAQT